MPNVKVQKSGKMEKNWNMQDSRSRSEKAFSRKWERNPDALPLRSLSSSLMFGFYRFEDACHYQGLRFVKFDAVRFGHEKFRRDSTSLWMESCNQDKDAQGRNRFSVWKEMDGTFWVAAISRLVMESVRTPPTPSRHSRGQSRDPKEVDWEAWSNAMSEEEMELERQGFDSRKLPKFSTPDCFQK